MLIPEHRTLLHQVAKQSVATGLQSGNALDCPLEDFPEALQQPAASFVTLHLQDRLRGCIGSLQASRPMVADVSHNAYAAAFLDRRFAPVSAQELPDLDFHIAILGPREPMTFTSREDLLGQLQPGVDGIVVSDKGQRATFLPAVWQSLAKPESFLSQLLMKAGLRADYWSDTLKVERYQVEEF